MNGTNRITEQQAIDARKKYVMAFNDTMLRIWQEKITMLNVIDTGALLASPKALPVRADGRFARKHHEETLATSAGRSVAKGVSGSVPNIMLQ